MTYVRENIPSKLLKKYVLPSDIGCIFLELNFRTCKWLLVGTYHKSWTLFFITISLRKTCFKNVLNPSCIGLFLTNNALSFQHTKTVSADLSDFHKLISKSKPREIHYRNYKMFN